MTFLSADPSRLLRLFLAGASLSLLLPSAAWSQRAPDGRTIIALVDALPVSDAKAVLLFRSRPTGDHIILLPTHGATPEALGGALAMLAEVAKRNDTPTASAVIPIVGLVAPENLSATQRVAWQRLLDDAARQPRVRVGRGIGQWVEVPARRLLN